MDTFINGTTSVMGLIGNPVAHSLSPQIHNHALRTLGLPYVYVPLAVTAEDLPKVVAALRAVNALGANVTLPHKQQAARLCDVLSPLSRKLGVVNTLYFREGQLYGTTTDPEGFLRALARMGHDAHCGNIVLLGNGGIARTLAAALAFSRIPETLTLVGRSRERVSALATELSASMDFPVAALAQGDAALGDAMARCTLLVNCTSAGLSPKTSETPLDKKFFHPGMTVFDTIYNPLTTRFLAEAGAAGCVTENGLRMLLYQAIASLSLWTGIDVREEIFTIEELQHCLVN
jgi:shikimate dehydrogenase